MLTVLLVDDDADVREFVGNALRGAGHTVTLASDGEEAMRLLDSICFDVVVTDIRLPRANGHAVLRHARRAPPRPDVILMTSFAAVPDAVAAMKDGAYDYLTKPFEPEELSSRLARIEEARELHRATHEAPMAGDGIAGLLIGASPPMVRLRERIETVAPSDAPVLIVGESGSGKELASRALHVKSARRDGPFVAVNCAAFPETLLEAELFGYERGAFTGATRRREGRFQAASGGTLLLDEVAEMPLSAQAKLLRVLQEGRVEPLGTNESVKVDVRIVSATNRDLKKRVSEGAFRNDLYFRLNGVTLAMPSLRERRTDLPMLIHHFLRRFVPQEQELPEVTLRAWGALMTYPFPGNVRELAHAVQHAVVLSRGRTIDLEHLPEDVVGGQATQPDADVRPLNAEIKRFEREYLIRALAVARHKRTRAAEMLGISRKNLWEKLRAHGISDAEVDE